MTAMTMDKSNDLGCDSSGGSCGPDQCPKCGGPLECGMKAGKEHCWCKDLPQVMPVTEKDSSCLCRKCLEEEIALQRLNKGGG